MIKKFIMIIIIALTMISTVLLAYKWHVLDNEQQAFAQLADKVVNKKQYISKGYIDSKPTETVGKEEGKKIDILPEYLDLFAENPDFAGWIVINDTIINYPVMQTPGDVEYYLHRDFERHDSYSGTPFVGTGNLQDLQHDIFLYGHNMRNGTMFAELLNYQQKEFWENHQTIQLDSRSERRSYTVFTAMLVNEQQWSNKDGLFSAFYTGQREEWIKKLINLGLYETDIIPQSPLLFLVTCSQEERFVVVAFQKTY